MSKKRVKKLEPNPQVPATLQAFSTQEVAKLTKMVENIPTVYFNHARVAAGYLDFRIFFGEQTVSPTGQVAFSENLCVAMTPEFARLFVLLLGQQVSNYEKTFGIREAPQNLEMARKLAEQVQKLTQ